VIHVLVARCDERQLHILFEAAAEGIRDVVVSGDEDRFDALDLVGDRRPLLPKQPG
jgi:hypothetical protein